jgi:hypothetical protein
MRSIWPTVCAFALAVFVLTYAYKQAHRHEVEIATSGPYMARIAPIEKELRDVRHNLRAISKGIPIHESLSHIAADAKRENVALASITTVPADYSAAQGQFLSWARILEDSVQLAKGKPDKISRQRIAENVARADQIYDRLEMQVSPQE